MAKKNEKVLAPKYPSQFGSHASMIDEAATADLIDKENVICVDDMGSYKTSRKNLDNGLADPARFAQSRQLKKVIPSESLAAK